MSGRQAAPSCPLPPRGASVAVRARAWLACRPCALGWAAYLVVAILAVVHFAR